MIDAVKSKKIVSILSKISVYCDFYRSTRDIGDFPVGVEECARDAASAGKITYLKKISSELNVRIREMLNESEQDVIIKSMIEMGVESADLPPSINLRKIRALITRGVIKTEREHQLARYTIDSDLVKALSQEEFEILGEALDKYQAKHS